MLAASQALGVGVIVSAFLFGFRHGIDWDHIAAITDITSSQEERGRALEYGTIYALGHALVVFVIGVVAIVLGAKLPDGVDAIMERVVGVTLILLGVYVFTALVRHGREFRMRSRWMLVFAGVRRAWRGAQTRLHGHAHDGAAHVHPVADAGRYGPRTALGTGLIHGVGAETGTQVLLIAAVGGAASQGLGVAMLLAFVVGLLVSNSAVALLTSAGFVSAGRARGLYVSAGVLTAVFSLAVGSFALLGISDRLPDLQQALAAVFGQLPV